MNPTRRKFRAVVADRLQGVHLKCPELSPKDLRVLNVSEVGVGVETQHLKTVPNRDQVLAAKLLVGRTSAAVNIRVIRSTPESTGIEFVAPSELLCSAIRQYFEPELAGASLLLVRPEQSDDRQQLYESEQGARLWLALPDQELVKFAIQVTGNSVEWSADEGLRLVQGEQRELVPDFLRRQLVQFIQSAVAVPAEIRSRVETLLLKAEIK